MMKKEKLGDSVFPDMAKRIERRAKSKGYDKERLMKYKIFAVGFSYPDGKFFNFFPELAKEKEKLVTEYDHLFRSNEIWLFTAEYVAENEFQRANILADISGFYKAFGVEPDKERPDSLVCELEFMHYLVFKEIYANTKEKASICIDAQKKFFHEHLYPGAMKIAESIISKTEGFYKEIATEMIDFLKCEYLYLVL